MEKTRGNPSVTGWIKAKAVKLQKLANGQIKLLIKK